jgi:hypothetical protein
VVFLVAKESSTKSAEDVPSLDALLKRKGAMD